MYLCEFDVHISQGCVYFLVVAVYLQDVKDFGFFNICLNKYKSLCHRCLIKLTSYPFYVCTYLFCYSSLHSIFIFWPIFNMFKVSNVYMYKIHFLLLNLFYYKSSLFHQQIINDY